MKHVIVKQCYMFYIEAIATAITPFVFAQKTSHQTPYSNSLGHRLPLESRHNALHYTVSRLLYIPLDRVARHILDFGVWRHSL
jgi:hypothetical protein